MQNPQNQPTIRQKYASTKRSVSTGVARHDNRGDQRQRGGLRGSPARSSGAARLVVRLWDFRACGGDLAQRFVDLVVLDGERASSMSRSPFARSLSSCAMIRSSATPWKSGTKPASMALHGTATSTSTAPSTNTNGAPTMRAEPTPPSHAGVTKGGGEQPQQRPHALEDLLRAWGMHRAPFRPGCERRCRRGAGATRSRAGWFE